MNHPAHSQAETLLNYAVMGAGLAAGAIIVAPVAIPALGVGTEVAATLAEECCTIVGVNTGAAGWISQAIDKIPAIGTYLCTEGGNNVLVPAVTVLGGQAVGNLMSQIEHSFGRDGSIGQAIRATSLTLGVVLALPAILPGIGHGIQFISRMTGFEEIGVAIAKAIGNTTACTSVASTNGIMGGGSALLAHMPCVLSAAITTIPAAGVAAGAHSEQLIARRAAAGHSADSAGVVR